jgi:hypothetical protein
LISLLSRARFNLYGVLDDETLAKNAKETIVGL